MELTPKLNERVLAALSEALKDLKPRPAVDRIFGMRLTGKYSHYCQFLLAYAPNTYGVAYVGLDKPSEPKITIHGPEAKTSKIAATKERLRLQKAEEKQARQTALEEKKAVGAAKETKAVTVKKAEPEPKATAKPKTRVQAVAAKRGKVPVVPFNPAIPTLDLGGAQTKQSAKAAKKPPFVQPMAQV